jgi:hypothetical protein
MWFAGRIAFFIFPFCLTRSVLNKPLAGELQRNKPGRFIAGNLNEALYCLPV